MRDLRYAVRTLVRNPGFTLTAAGSLALAIGGSVAVFTLLNAIVLRALPVQEPDRVFRALRVTSSETVGRHAWPAIERAQRVLAGQAEIAAASNMASMPLQPPGRTGPAERGVVQLVSGEYFELLRQRPQRGRLLAPSDNVTVGAHPVAVISDAYWRLQLSASEQAVGQTLAISGTAFTVIGVADRQFFGTTVGVRGPDVWIPLVMQPVVRYAQNASSHDGADTRKPWPAQETIEWVTAFVRVPRATSPLTIAAALTVQRQREADSIFSTGSLAGARDDVRGERIILESASRGISTFRDSVSSTLFLLLAMMGVLLAIACANVAGLLIARASAREREMAIRVSIGAGRWQLLRQTLIESLLLGGLAGAAGILLAFWTRDALLKMFAPTATLITLDTGLDARVLAFGVGISLLTGLACGILPAVRGSRASIAGALKAQTRAGGGDRRSLFVGRALVTLQMAFCMLALVVAALFVRSLTMLASMDIGFDHLQVLTARLDVPSLAYTPEQRQALYGRILARLQQIPGVTSASLSHSGPLAGSTRNVTFAVEGYALAQRERLSTHEEIVTEDYFATVGLRLLQGRFFGPEDRGSRNTLVNETIARRFFPHGDALGKRWDYGGPIDSASFVIIGVVEDAKYVELRTAPPNMVYHLSAARPEFVLVDLEVRTTGSPAAMAATIRQALARSEARLAVLDAVPLGERLARGVARDSLTARLTSIFGAIGLLLASLGLYGTISYGISRRVPEIGLRMALGADRRSVLGMVMREALLVVIAGAALGIPLAYLAGRSLQTMLYGIPAMDPVAYAAGAALLVAVSALAAFLPARRASWIEPMAALNRQ
jgi:putative ABC transport system permease protein